MDLPTRVRLAVGAASIEPHGLAPGATLLVRRMEDPLPGGLLRGTSGFNPSPEWQQAARMKLTELAREAARPAFFAGAGLEVGDARLVVFNDDAELLACFARDAAAGRAGTRWWWRQVAGMRQGRQGASGGESVLIGESIAAVFAQRPEAAPAAIALLFKWRAAAPVLQVLGARGAEAVLAAVARAWGTAVPEEAAGHSWGMGGEAGGEVTALFSARGSEPVIEASGEFAAVSPVAMRLAGLCLLLSEEPHRARSAGLARHVQSALLRAGALKRMASPPPSPEEIETSREEARAGLRAVPDEVETRRAEIPEAEMESSAATEVGGVFFLIAALRACGVFDELPDGASPWALLEFCGKCLLGDRYPAFAFDPVWRLLRMLGGADPDLPLADIEYAALQASPNSSEAFALLEAPPGWRGLLAGVLPGLAAALRDALEADDFAEALLLRNARVWVTRTHVDVVIPLAETSVAVRRAGLDFNPGWVPVLGRVITFHYREGRG